MDALPISPFDSVTVRRAVLQPRLSVWEVAVTAGAVFPVHAHDDYVVRLMLEGSLSEQIGRRRREIVPFTIHFNRRSEEHLVNVHRRTVRYLSVEYSPEFVVRMHACLPRSMQVLGDGAARTSFRIYRELLCGDDLSPLAIEGLSLELLAAVARTPRPLRTSPAPDWLRRAEEILRASYKTPPTLAELATAVDTHPAHLTRTFRLYHGTSMGEFVRRLRFETACREIAHTGRPLARVAARAGFADHSHMCREFKHRVGVTPAEFRSVTRSHRESLDDPEG